MILWPILSFMHLYHEKDDTLDLVRQRRRVPKVLMGHYAFHYNFMTGILKT